MNWNWKLSSGTMNTKKCSVWFRFSPMWLEINYNFSFFYILEEMHPVLANFWDRDALIDLIQWSEINPKYQLFHILGEMVTALAKFGHWDVWADPSQWSEINSKFQLFHILGEMHPILARTCFGWFQPMARKQSEISAFFTFQEQCNLYWPSSDKNMFGLIPAIGQKSIRNFSYFPVPALRSLDWSLPMCRN